MSLIDRYAVIGSGIRYSRSPYLHARFAQATGQAMEYGLIDVPAEGFLAAVQEFFAAGGRGLNITVPFKTAAVPLAAALTPRARRAAAVNTLAQGLGPGGGLLGDNTDGAGLVRDLAHTLGYRLQGARVLLLGAGGAARGVIAPLVAAGASELEVLNRDAARARQLAAQFSDLGAVRALNPVDDAATAVARAAAFDLVINATSASLHGALPQVPAQAVGPHTLCYDLAYGAEDTVFVRWARAAGAARAEMGLGMLVEQAAEAFYLWRGVRPETAPVLAGLKAELAASRTGAAC
jgi:shikimate dehydrogenase